MKDSTRRRLETLLLLSRRPSFVASSAALNAMVSTVGIMLWPSIWTYVGAGIGCVLILLDVRYLVKLLTSP